MEKWNLIIYAPAYNVERQIGEFLGGFIKIGPELAGHGILLHKLIIIDDASTDGTNRIISDFSKDNGFVHIIRNEVNLGPLQSLLEGMQETTRIIEKEGLRAENTMVARMDTDMEHDPSEIGLLLEPIAGGKVDMSVGVSDFRDYQFSVRLFNRHVGASESRRFLGTEIPQFCPGFYAMKGDAFFALSARILKAQEIFKKEFGKDMLTIDFIILALAKGAGFSLSQVPLPPVDKRWVKKSKIRKLLYYFGYHLNTMDFLGRHLEELCRH